MASRGQSIVAYYYAWNTSTSAYVTGDVANHAVRWCKDGTASATTNAPAEVDAANFPGLYKVTLTAAEATCDTGKTGGKSSTANVVLLGESYTFEQLPTAAPGATNGLPQVGVAPLTHLTGDAFARLGAPAGASVSADLAAVHAKTTALPADPAGLASLAAAHGAGSWATATGFSTLTTADIPTTAAIADKVLGRSIAGGADGGRTVTSALQALRNRVVRSAGSGTIVVYQEDDTTIAWQGTIIVSGSATPVIEIDPA